MRNLLIAVAAAAVFTTGSALAADIAARPYTKAPPIVAAPTWAGWYVGVNLGGAWGDGSPGFANPFTAPGNNFAVCGAPAGAVLPAPVGGLSTDCGHGSSFIGGGQIGYNWQTGTWVFGLEADGAWQNVVNRSYTRFGANGSSAMGGVVNDTAYLRSKIDSLGTVRGRIGYAPSNWLLYITGGLAVGGVDNSVAEILNPGNACTSTAACRASSDNSVRVGWTIGAGAEWLIVPNWSVGVEYLYVDLGRTSITQAPAGGFFSNTSVSTFDNTEHMVRAKLNYHFGGPVVAKY